MGSRHNGGSFLVMNSASKSQRFIASTFIAVGFGLPFLAPSVVLPAHAATTSSRPSSAVETTKSAQMSAEAKLATSNVLYTVEDKKNDNQKASKKVVSKKSVEEMAYDTMSAQLASEKKRSDIVVKQLLPQAKNALRSSKGEQTTLKKNVEKIDKQRSNKKLDKDVDVEKKLFTQKSEVMQKLKSQNQVVDGDERVVQRLQGEAERLKKSTNKDTAALKSRKDRFKKKEAELVQKVKAQQEAERKKIMEQKKQELFRASVAAKDKRNDAKKSLDDVERKATAATKKSLEKAANVKGLQKNEANRIKLVNNLQDTLKKETAQLAKEQDLLLQVMKESQLSAKNVKEIKDEVSHKQESYLKLDAKYAKLLKM